MAELSVRMADVRPAFLPRARWGYRLGSTGIVDGMYKDGFDDPLSGLIMGETAEILARQYRITREQSDCFALESQRPKQTGDLCNFAQRWPA